MKKSIIDRQRQHEEIHHRGEEVPEYLDPSVAMEPMCSYARDALKGKLSTG